MTSNFISKSIYSPLQRSKKDSSNESTKTPIETNKIDIACSSHTKLLESCPNCSDKLISGIISTKNNLKLLKKLKLEIDSTEKLKAEIELLKTELKDLCDVSELPPGQATGDLHQELYQKPMPNNLFSNCKSAEMSLSYMLKLGVFQNTLECKRCGETMRLHGRGGLGFVYKCSNCKKILDFKTGTV